MRDFTALNVPVQAQRAGHARYRSYDHKRKADGRKELIAAICVVMLFTVCGSAFFCADLLRTDRVSANVILDYKSIGGLTRPELESMFAYLRSSSPSDLQVTIDGKTWRVPAKSIDARYSVDETIDEALLIGHSGGLLQRLDTVLSLRNEPRQLFFHLIYNDAKLAEVATQIAIEASVPATDATMRFNPDSPELFQYAAGAPGRAVNLDDLQLALKKSLSERVPVQVAMDAKKAAPAVTVESLKSQTQLLGSFTTALTADPMRNNNIKLASKVVSGATLRSGGEFSFNSLTGERTKKMGYVDAPSLSNGKLIEEPGGGICQVSTTVYNAALLAGLKVVERHPHSRPMDYVVAGLDATVDFGSNKDLRLKNESDSTIYLIVRVDELRRLITAEFYGTPPGEAISVVSEGYRVVMPPKPVEITNAGKPIGWSNTLTDARQGCSVRIYRVYTSGGDTKKELISEDYYPPQQGKIEIGTKSSGKNK